MVKILYVLIIQLAILAVVAPVFLMWLGPALAILFFMVWCDKALLSLLKIHGHLGIELLTIPVVLAGIIYGSVFGFLFGFLIVSIIGGSVEIISWIVSPPVGGSWLPIIPSIDHFYLGLTGVIGGILGGIIPIMFIIAMASAVKSFLGLLTVKFADPYPITLSYYLNIAYNTIIAFAFSNYLNIIVAMGSVA